jgi:glycerophosphoryl diester phosphodiesterase
VRLAFAGTPEFAGAVLQRLHGAGQWAMCYTINDDSGARALLAMGLDGLITDAVDHFAPHAGRLGV